MEGTTLINHVSRLYPDVIRVIVSEPEDRTLVMRSIESTHQFFAAPYDLQRLTSTIDRSLSLRELLTSESLQRVVGGMTRLPSVPSVYRELMAELSDDDASIVRMGEIVSRDAAMTAKILQVVNSAIYCLSKPVSDPVQAVSLLGASTLKSLVLAVGVFEEFQSNSDDGFSADGLMHHCLGVSRIAKELGQREGLEAHELDDAVTAAMLHDIGKLILHSIDPQAYAQTCRFVEQGNQSLVATEREVFGTDHASVGAYLLNLWGLPQSIVEIVGLHHAPTRAYEMAFSPLTAVVAANWFCRLFSDGQPEELSDELTRYFEMVACHQKLQPWCDTLGAQLPPIAN